VSGQLHAPAALPSMKKKPRYPLHMTFRGLHTEFGPYSKGSLYPCRNSNFLLLFVHLVI